MARLSGRYQGCLVILFSLVVASSLCDAQILPSLPLKVLFTTPPDLLNVAQPNITISGRDTITAVFSRPVIALGSDFGEASLPASLTPFTIKCDTGDDTVLGDVRWVTTSIARFDVRTSWPTDLSCSFAWNKQLKTFDGVPLQLPANAGIGSITLRTTPLVITIGDVTSELGNNLTRNQYNAYRGMPDDNFPEYLPGANLTLLFNYPVEFSLLSSALRTSACCNSSAGSQQTIRVLPCGPPFRIRPVFGPGAGVSPSNGTCAVVQLTPGIPAPRRTSSPPLVQGGLKLTLPTGARYSRSAGTFKDKPLEIYLWGPRRFRIPLRQNFQQLANATDDFNYPDNGISYRRMTMWLPLGLASGVTVAQLSAQMSLCKYAKPYDWFVPCNPVKFSLSQSNKGQLLMTVPSFLPREHYKLVVKGTDQIKDGMGSPLETSEAYFYTTDPSSDLQMPGVASGSRVILFESPVRPPTFKWPVVMRGKPAGSYNGARVSAWNVSASSLASIITSLRSDVKSLPKPDQTVVRRNTSLTRFEALTMTSSPLQLVAMYDYNGNIQTWNFLVQSQLQFSSVTMQYNFMPWVTRTTTEAPVPGARVTTLLFEYNNKRAEGPSCTTDATGSCTLDMRPIMTKMESFAEMYVVVQLGDEVLVVTGGFSFPYVDRYNPPSRYQATLVLDRALVRPGEKLAITGYVQAKNGSRLTLPKGLSSMAMQVSPGFKEGDYTPYAFNVSLDATYGSFRTTVNIPATAPLQTYDVQLLVPGTKTGNTLTSQQILVSDPRPPTALINITVPSWAPPKSTVRAHIKALSYIGADVANADMTVTWNVPLALGRINITTNATGEAEVAIPLGALPPHNATNLDDILNIEVSWVGPTRELIKETKAVRIGNGPVRTLLRFSPQTQVPGIPFTVSAENFANDQFSTPLEGVTVRVSLALRNASTSSCSPSQLEAVQQQRCTVVSGQAPRNSPCLLQLPCMAEFTIRACAQRFANGSAIVGAGGKAPCSESPVGFNKTTWAATPWTAPPSLRLLVAKANQTLNSDVSMFFVNPYWGAATGRLVWGNGDVQKQRYLGPVSPGFQRVTQRIGDECLGGCVVTLVLSVARRWKNAGPLPGAAPVPSDALVPRSKLFDPLGPITEDSTVTLRVLEDNMLTVNVTAKGVGVTATGDPVLRPLGPGQLEVLVKDGVTGAPVPSAEVTLMVTDRAILDLYPYPLVDLASVMEPVTEANANKWDMDSSRTSLSNLNTTFNMLQARLQADPWLPIVTSISNSLPWDYGGWANLPILPATNPVDIPLDKYLATFTSPVTTTPFYSWGLTQRYPGGSGVGTSDPSAALRLGRDFQTTPVFKVVTTNEEGVASLAIKAPGNLGAFAVRAYVVNKGSTSAASKYGSNESQVVVRNPLSVTPSVPRQVRTGDAFDAGVIVTIADATGDEPVTVTARVVTNDTLPPVVELVGATDGASSVDVTITKKKTSQEARFRFKALGVGTAVVRFLAQGSSDADQDGVEMEIPVLGRQGSVFLGTSFAVVAGDGSDGQQEEGLAMPPAEPNSGSIQVTAGVGYLPASKALYQQMVEQQGRLQDVEDLSGGTAVSTAVLPAILLQYDSPGLVNASQLNASSVAAGVAIKPLTQQNMGLMWYKPSATLSAYQQPSVELNAWGVWILRETNGMAKESGDKTVQAYYSKLQATATSTWQPLLGPTLSKQAVQALTPLIISDANGRKRPATYTNWEDLSWVRLVNGAGWAPSGNEYTAAGPEVQKAVQQALSTDRLIAAATSPGNTTIGVQARTGLMLLRELQKGGAAAAPAYRAAADKISTQLQGQMRVSGRVGYIAGRPGAAWAASLEDQAQALLFLVRHSPKAPLLQKLAAYVGSGGQISGLVQYCPPVGGTGTATTALALSTYDAARGSNKPDLVLTATASRSAAPDATPFKLLSATFKPANAGQVFSSNTSYDTLSSELGGQPDRASFVAKGRGEVSVAVGLDFVPAALLPFPSYRGIWVDAIIQSEAGEGRLITAPLASIVTVAVQLTTPDDLGAVVVEVRMPGGLEPVDPNVYQDASLALTCSSAGSWFWWWCPRQSTSPSLVKFTFSYLSAGTVTLKFKAVAATPGRFVLPPVKAFAVSQPEVMGLSAAGNFSVCPVKRPAAAATADAAPVAGQTPVPWCSEDGAQPGDPLAVPKACPKDCSLNGVCNLAKGTCVCNQGFSGAACDKFTTS